VRKSKGKIHIKGDETVRPNPWQELAMNNPISDTFALQLQQMRQDLLARLRAQRGGQVSRAEAAAQARDQQSDDWAKADAERDLTVALEERESAELVAIDEALQRLSDGSFGLCVDCGVSIPTARLHANPTAMRCVACQDKQEHARGVAPHAGY
jgi:DnaK suppressor protein